MLCHDVLDPLLECFPPRHLGRGKTSVTTFPPPLCAAVAASARVCCRVCCARLLSLRWPRGCARAYEGAALRRRCCSACCAWTTGTSSFRTLCAAATKPTPSTPFTTSLRVRAGRLTLSKSFWANHCGPWGVRGGPPPVNQTLTPRFLAGVSKWHNFYSPSSDLTPQVHADALNPILHICGRRG